MKLAIKCFIGFVFVLIIAWGLAAGLLIREVVTDPDGTAETIGDALGAGVKAMERRMNEE